MAYLLWSRCKEWHECVHGNHPWGDGSANILSKERAKGDILPFLYEHIVITACSGLCTLYSYLNIPSTPVVHEDHTEDVFLSLCHWHRLAQGGTRTYKERLWTQFKEAHTLSMHACWLAS